MVWGPRAPSHGHSCFLPNVLSELLKQKQEAARVTPAPSPCCMVLPITPSLQSAAAGACYDWRACQPVLPEHLASQRPPPRSRQELGRRTRWGATVPLVCRVQGGGPPSVLVGLRSPVRRGKDRNECEKCGWKGRRGIFGTGGGCVCVCVCVCAAHVLIHLCLGGLSGSASSFLPKSKSGHGNPR